MLLKSTITGLALGVALASGSVYAYDTGDIIVRVGAVSVDPREDSSELTINGTPLTTALAGVADVSPATAGVDGNMQLGLNFTYMVMPNFGVELLAATPFTHDVTANLGAVGVVKAAEVSHLPPTLTAQFFPMDAGSAFQPYVGAGINYTIFFDEKAASELNAVTTSLGLGNATKVKLDDSVGLALEVGCDYAISDQLALNAAIWKVNISTTAKFIYADGTKIEGDVDIDPMVYMLSLAYKL